MRKELKVIELPKWGNFLRLQWREFFVSHLTVEEQKSIHLNEFLWYLCACKKVEYLEEEKAIEAFENQLKHKCTIFLPVY